MPIVIKIRGIRFYFYSDDHEPIHIHVKGHGGEAKIEVEPQVVLVYSRGFSRNDIGKIMEIVRANRDAIIAKWKEHFDDSETEET